MELAHAAEQILAEIIVGRLLRIVDARVAAEGVAVGARHAIGLLDVEERGAALLGRMLGEDIGDAAAVLRQLGIHGAKVEHRRGARVVDRRRREEERIDLVRVAVEHRHAEHADDDRREPEEGAAERDEDVEGQRPDAEPVVEVGLLQPLRSAEPQVEGVAKDARMREDARDERGQQSDADQPDEEDAPGDGEVEVDVEARDEFGPRKLGRWRELTRGVGDELAVLVGIDMEEEAREIGGGERDIDMLDPRAARSDRAFEGGLDRGGARFGELRRRGAFPALELVREDRDAARQADEIDERGEGEAEAAVPAQHRADEACGDARHQVLFLRGFRGGSGGHAKPFTMAAVKLIMATPVSTAVARRMRLSARVHAMQPPQITGTIIPPTTSRVCCSPGTSAA